MRLGLDEAAHQPERADELAPAREHAGDQRVVGARAADHRALDREARGPVVQHDAGGASHHARSERLVQALEQRYRHAVAVDRAHAHRPAGGLGHAARELRPASADVLGREQPADVGSVAHRRERVLERERDRPDELGQR